MIYGRAEPHLITPIAHLGYFGKVQKAPYDQINVEQAIKEMVAELPRGEAGYLDALRAYTDAIYAQMLRVAAARQAALPRQDARLRARAAIPHEALSDARTTSCSRAIRSRCCRRTSSRSSTATIASRSSHNPSSSATCRRSRGMVRERPVPNVYVRYEELVKDPETHFRRVCDHLGIPFEEKAIGYGESGEAFKGLGDPTGVARHTRPVTTSVSKWAAEIASNPETLALVSRRRRQLDPADLETLGYPRAKIVEQLAAARGRAACP